MRAGNVWTGGRPHPLATPFTNSHAAASLTVGGYTGRVPPQVTSAEQPCAAATPCAIAVIRSIVASIVAGSKARSVPPRRARSGVTLKASPPASCVTETTMESSGDVARETIVCIAAHSGGSYESAVAAATRPPGVGGGARLGRIWSRKVIPSWRILTRGGEGAEAKVMFFRTHVNLFAVVNSFQLHIAMINRDACIATRISKMRRPARCSVAITIWQWSQVVTRCSSGGAWGRGGRRERVPGRR